MASWLPLVSSSETHKHTILNLYIILTEYIIYGLPALTKREVKMDIGQVIFLRVYGLRWSQGPGINMQKKRTRPISTHLDRTSLVNKGFIVWIKVPKHDKFSLQGKACVLSGQDSSILPTWVANHSPRFGSCCPLTELVIIYTKYEHYDVQLIRF